MTENLFFLLKDINKKYGNIFAYAWGRGFWACLTSFIKSSDGLSEIADGWFFFYYYSKLLNRHQRQIITTIRLKKNWFAEMIFALIFILFSSQKYIYVYLYFFYTYLFLFLISVTFWKIWLGLVSRLIVCVWPTTA